MAQLEIQERQETSQTHTVESDWSQKDPDSRLDTALSFHVCILSLGHSFSSVKWANNPLPEDERMGCHLDCKGSQRELLTDGLWRSGKLATGQGFSQGGDSK